MVSFSKTQQAICVGAFVWAIVVVVSLSKAGTELWPFSYFGMYTTPRTKNLVILEIKEESPQQGRNLLLALGNYRFSLKALIEEIVSRGRSEIEVKNEIRERIVLFLKKNFNDVESVRFKVSYWKEFKNRTLPDVEFEDTIRLKPGPNQHDDY